MTRKENREFGFTSPACSIFELALTDWNLQEIQGAQFKIHYEVEGPCEENGI